MRPWLVLTGMILLTIAAGAVATLYFAGQSGAVTSQTRQFGPTSVGPTASLAVDFYGPNGSAENFVFSWSANRTLGVTLVQTGSCAVPPCPPTLLASWPGNLSGRWSGQETLRYPVVATFQNRWSDPVTLDALARASGSAKVSIPFWTFAAVGSASGALFVLGGLAVFLGVFLRGDPYGPGPRPVSRSAEHAESIVPDDPHDQGPLGEPRRR